MECGGSDTIKVMGPKEFISSNSNIETTTAPKMGQLQFDCYFCFVSLVSCVYKNFPHFFIFVNILDPAKLIPLLVSMLNIQWYLYQYLASKAKVSVTDTKQLAVVLSSILIVKIEKLKSVNIVVLTTAVPIPILELLFGSQRYRY